MKNHAKVGEHEIIFSSPLAKQVFFKRNKGKSILIEIDDAPTSEMRRFFEGCIVPVVFYAHPKSGWKDFSEARDALKLEFLGKEIRNMKGDKVKVIRSTADLSKEKFSEFVNTVIQWITENELAPTDAIDPENYKRWRDTEDSPIYPPLARLKALYDKAQGDTLPPWRKVK